MDFRKLSHFIAVSQAGSLTAAADLLNQPQPALSRDIRQLEKEIGTALFYRNGRGMALTPDGQDFLDAIAPPLEALRRAYDDLANRRTTRRGLLRLGWVGSISGSYGAQIVARFAQQFPDVELQARGGSSVQIREWLKNGEIDLGILNAERRAKGAQEHLMRTPLYHVARAGPDTRLPTISLREALSDDLMLYNRNFALRRVVEAVAQQHGINLNVVAQIDEVRTVLHLIKAEGGATVSTMGLLDEFREESLAKRKIVDPVVWLYFWIVFPKTTPSTEVASLARIFKEETRHAIAEGRFEGEI